MLTRLNTVCKTILDSFDGKPYSMPELLTAALPDACAITREYIEDTTVDTLRAIFARLIPKRRGHAGARVQPKLRGFEDILLPLRIAVPPPGEEETTEEDGDSVLWYELPDATLAQARRNVRMRDALIGGALNERNIVHAVVEAAEYAGGIDEDKIGDILK
jgi:hypothetical protein